MPLVLFIIGQAIFTPIAARPSAELGLEMARYVTEESRFASQMTPEQRRQTLEQAEAQSRQGLGPGLLVGVGAAIVFTAIGWAVNGLAIHGLVTLLGSQTSRPGGMMAVASWAWLPFWVKLLVQSVFVARSGELPRHEGLAFLVTNGNRILDSLDPLYVFLGRFDLWQVANWVLLIIGVSALSGLSRSKAALVVLPLWLVFALVGLVPIFLSSMFL